MPRFQELQADWLGRVAGPDKLVAKRYAVMQRLGHGSFGCVYLVTDSRAGDGEQLKVLKEVPLGPLRPNDTVQASNEARLLSRLHHPHILRFFHSFLEHHSFCIITEYCQDKDLDYKLREVKKSGRSLSESQVVDWLLQLLLGVHYMHDRRILHRDLKSKNVFLKRNLVKIGDFGVSCLLIGSCDLATTFTGTPYYMSPEVLNHCGYDCKSDIWALGCIIYEMCCLSHAFEAPSFLSVVVKIVEGPTPSLPPCYSPDLSSVMQRMLDKQPSSRPGAADVLRSSFFQKNMQRLKEQYSVSLDQSSLAEKHAAQIAQAMQGKVHLRTLRERSEVERMTPRERMRLRKLQTADEKAGRLRLLAEEKYREVSARRQELRARHFETLSLDVLTARPRQDELNSMSFHESTEGAGPPSQPITAEDRPLSGGREPMRKPPAKDMCPVERDAPGIPVDPQTAESYYDQEEFESCSDEEELTEQHTATDSRYASELQDSDLEAMMRQMERILEGEAGGDSGSELGAPSVASEGSNPQDPPGPPYHPDPPGPPYHPDPPDPPYHPDPPGPPYHPDPPGPPYHPDPPDPPYHPDPPDPPYHPDPPGPPYHPDPPGSQDLAGVHSSLVETCIQRMREVLCGRLGDEVFEGLYEDLKEARQRGERGSSVLDTLVPRDGFLLDQILYHEDQQDQIPQSGQQKEA